MSLGEDAQGARRRGGKIIKKRWSLNKVLGVIKVFGVPGKGLYTSDCDFSKGERNIL